ncbi:MAG: TolC family protein [bacterium]
MKMGNNTLSFWGKGFRSFFALLFLLIFSTAGAQDSLILNLDESIAIALDKSYDIMNIEQLVVRAERNLWAAKAGYRTNIEAQIFAPTWDEGFRLIDVVEGTPVAKQQGSFQVRGFMDIIQPMPWLPFGGGDLRLRSEAYQLNSWTPSTFDPTLEIKANKVYTSMSAIINKPLFTINTLSLGLKQAELDFERQSRVYKRSELDLVYNVTSSFFEFYRRSQEYQINREQVERQEGIYRTTKNKFDAGLIAEVEAMQAEVELIQYQNDLKTSEGSLQQQEAAFKQIIGIPLDRKVNVTTELELKPIVIDAEKAVGLALQNRSEIVERKIDIENSQIDIRQIDAQVAIKGNISGYYRFAGFSDAGLPWGTATGELFQSSWDVLKRTPNRGVTFDLEIPIWDWGRNRAQVDAAKSSMKRNELALDNLYITIEREVRDIVRKVYEAYDRVEMLVKSNEVSQRSFDISIQRFANGDITSVELVRANDQLNNSKLSYLRAYIDYELALADLKRKTLYDFEKDQSLVEEKD